MRGFGLGGVEMRHPKHTTCPFAEFDFCSMEANLGVFLGYV